MRRALVTTALLLVGSSWAFAETPVWFWFATCRGPAMALEVRFDRATLYHAEFPTCQADRSSWARRGQESGKIRLLFKPTRSITWEGYREPAAVSSAGMSLDIDIWQAGADPSDLLLGVSVSDANDIYMNTIHIAQPGKRDTSTIADGLEIVTFPVTGDAPRKP